MIATAPVRRDRRVIITGLGWVTSLGTDVNGVWQDLVRGRSGIHPITRFDTSQYRTKFGGEVPDWKGGPNIEKREAKRLDRFAQFALNAAIDAVNDANIDFEKENLRRCGSIVGTTIGGVEEFERNHEKLLRVGPSLVSPFMIPKLMCNAGSGNVSIHYGLKGPNLAVASACASGAHAIGQACDQIRYGVAEIMIAGGTEAALTPIGLAGFAALRALSQRKDDPQSASRPFEKNRDGFVLSEGAGILVLEEYEHAKRRGAKAYAELLGYGQSADGTHITAPQEDGQGAANAMEAALEDAAITSSAIEYINAHGAGTRLGDVAESRAIKTVFGDHEAGMISVSSTKSMTGHPLGAAGGIEAIITAKVIETGVIPPTINHDERDEECDLDYVPNTARDKRVRLAMSNSFGFGGHNVALVFGKM